jgi:hypothetical protein
MDHGVIVSILTAMPVLRSESRWDDPVVIASLAAAVGTMVLAVLTFVMSRATKKAAVATSMGAAATVELASASKRQLAAAEAQLKLTQDAVSTASRHADEATRARIDARAPLLQLLLRHPTWPPYLDRPSVAEVARAEPGMVFDLSKQGEQTLWFKTGALVRNEGATTAIVTISPGMRFTDVPGDYGDLGFRRDFKIPPRSTQGRYVLRPSEEGYLVIESCATVAVLASGVDSRRTGMSFEVIVTDQFDDGIVDNILIEILAFPLELVSGSLWQVREPQVPLEETNDMLGVNVQPIRRRYFVSKRDNVEAD